MRNKSKTHRLVESALFLALALVLPFFTGQIPQVGRMLCPMHLPVLLCGYLCGPFYALAVGLLSPLLRFVTFGAPTLFPTGVAMSVELAVYGLTSGLFYRIFPRNKRNVYFSLILAMLIGRIFWGIVMKSICLATDAEFTFHIFWISAFVNAIPGILVQIALIPLLVFRHMKEEQGTVGEEKKIFSRER